MRRLGGFTSGIVLALIHWTPAGHRVAAETATQFLLDRRLVP